MHWIIQQNLWNETGWLQMMAVLHKQIVPFTVVKVIPFIHELVPDIPNIDELTDDRVYVQGGTSLSLVAQRKGWFPGTFLNDNHNFKIWRQYYNRHCLNADAEVVPFEQAFIPHDEYRFIRPVEDNKSFAGTVLFGEEFATWKKAVTGLNEELCPLRPETEVLVAPLKEIDREYRYFIINGRVVTGSQYRVGDRVVKQRMSRHHPSWKFAARMAGLYQPALAFVMDVCNLKGSDSDWRVIEINNINSSGFYDIDVEAYVKAINKMALYER